MMEAKRVVSGTGGVVSADGERVAFLRWPAGQSATAELWVTDVESVKPPVRMLGSGAHCPPGRCEGYKDLTAARVCSLGNRRKPPA